MTGNNFDIPFYAKVTLQMVGFFVLAAILYITQSILIPLVFAIIIAIVLSPVVNYLIRHKINKNISIILAIILAFLLFAGLGLLIFSQISQLSNSWTSLVEKITAILNQSITQISGYLDIKPQYIYEWIDKTKSELINMSSSNLGQTLISVGSGIAAFFLIPFYVFFILFYQPIILEFIHKISGKENHDQVSKIVTETKSVVQKYLIGLLIEAVIIAVMDASALLLLGIDYAILLGVLGALLNVIPYIGGLVAVALPMAVALATKSSPMYAVYVLIAYYTIQLIDNHYIVPKIVASKVQINALFSIIVVLAGNALWGIPGMFLAIPVLAIVKILCDNIESLKPWGLLLGDSMPSILSIKPIFKRKKKV